MGRAWGRAEKVQYSSRIRFDSTRIDLMHWLIAFQQACLSLCGKGSMQFPDKTASIEATSRGGCAYCKFLNLHCRFGSRQIRHSDQEILTYSIEQVTIALYNTFQLILWNKLPAGCWPAGQLASQPASQPDSQPAVQPSGWPAGWPA